MIHTLKPRNLFTRELKKDIKLPLLNFCLLNLNPSIPIKSSLEAWNTSRLPRK